MTRIVRAGLRLVCRILTALFLNLEVDGLQHVPVRGPVMVACRHYHYQWDGVVLLATLQRSPGIVVALDWAPLRSLRSVMEYGCRLLAWPVVLRHEALDSPGARAYVQAEERGYVRRAVAMVAEQLHAGQVAIVFPEGYPNVDPVFTLKRSASDFLPVRPGFLVMAARAERRGGDPVAVVPAGLHYHRRRVVLRFGAPLYLHDFADREALRRVVEAQIHLLSLENQP